MRHRSTALCLTDLLAMAKFSTVEPIYPRRAPNWGSNEHSDQGVGERHYRKCLISWNTLAVASNLQGSGTGQFQNSKGLRAVVRAPCPVPPSLLPPSEVCSSVLVHYSQVPEVGAVYTKSGTNSAPNHLSKGSEHSTNLTSHVSVAL